MRQGLSLSCFHFTLQERSDRVRSNLKPGQFVAIFLDCPLEFFEKRDVRDRHKRAIVKSQFYRYFSPSEPPLKPEPQLKTHISNSPESVDKIINYLIQFKYVPPEVQ